MSRVSLLTDSRWQDRVSDGRVEAEDHRAEYVFDDAAKSVVLVRLMSRVGVGAGWGRWKWGRLMDLWYHVGGYETCVIWSAVGNWRCTGVWSGYYVWPRFGFDGPVSHHQRKRLPEVFHSCRTIQQVFARPGGAVAWKRFGGVLHDLTFDLRPGSESRRLFDVQR